MDMISIYIVMAIVAGAFYYLVKKTVLDDKITIK
jgi:hypothetical protein